MHHDGVVGRRLPAEGRQPAEGQQPAGVVQHELLVDFREPGVHVAPNLDLGGKIDLLVQAAIDEQRVVVDHLGDLQIHRLVYRQAGSAAFLVHRHILQHKVLQQIAGANTEAAEAAVAERDANYVDGTTGDGRVRDANGEHIFAVGAFPRVEHDHRRAKLGIDAGRQIAQLIGGRFKQRVGPIGLPQLGLLRLFDGRHRSFAVAAGEHGGNEN